MIYIYGRGIMYLYILFIYRFCIAYDNIMSVKHARRTTFLPASPPYSRVYFCRIRTANLARSRLVIIWSEKTQRQNGWCSARAKVRPPRTNKLRSTGFCPSELRIKYTTIIILLRGIPPSSAQIIPYRDNILFEYLPSNSVMSSSS